MDTFKLALVVMAITDSQYRRRDADGGCRQLTAEQLDARAEFGWHLPDLKGVLAACVNAGRLRRQPRASHRIEPSTVPSAAAPTQG